MTDNTKHVQQQPGELFSDYARRRWGKAIKAGIERQKAREAADAEASKFYDFTIFFTATMPEFERIKASIGSRAVLNPKFRFHPHVNRDSSTWKEGGQDA